MASGYREDRRIEGIRPLSAVSKNEATEGTDVIREKAYEAARERIADELRANGQPKKSFKDLLKKP